MTAISNPFFQSTTVFPPEEFAFFGAHIQHLKLSKGDYFFKPYFTCKQLGIVQKGLLRSFVTVADKEYNIEFYSEQQFVSAFTSFLTQKPSDWTIQALENTELITISHDLLQSLYLRHSCWVDFGKNIYEQQTIKKCHREKSLISSNASERYRLFREEYETIENRLPLFQIAAYLGIEPETLSRLRKK